MPVTGEQLRQLCDALVAAFPTPQSFTALVLFELGDNFDAVTAASHNLNDRAVELITWCQSRGRLDDLVRGAKAQNPDHPGLDAVFRAWPFTPPPGAADPRQLPKGQRVGEKNVYTVDSLLGCGAMGVVYRVLDANERPRALKLLLGRAMRDRQALERIKREATVSARFDDEARGHVVDVFDVGHDPRLGDGGCAFLAMELLRGETLAERVARGGRLPPATALLLAEQLARVLQEAGRAELRVVHCDLKPDNLFLARLPGGEALKVLDFGIAQVLREQTIGQAYRLTGTPLFAAPEQWEPDAPLTPAADLWAFGLIVFYALTGRYFWRSAVLPGLMEEILLQRAYPPASERARAVGVTLPEGFDAWFARCVCPDAAGRYRDAAEVFAALRALPWPADLTRPLPGPEAPPPPRASIPVTCRVAPPPEERGEGLDERVARAGPMALADVTAMLRAVVTWLALQRAVSPVKGHLEPSRVRFLDDGSVRVLGLEAASVTDARGGAGATRTLLHGAPGVGYVPAALRRSGEVDDLWALARVAFFALTGSHWERGTGVREALRDEGSEAPSARSHRVPAGFDAWFARCSAREGAGRFEGAQAAVDALATLRVEAASVVEAPRAPEAERPRVVEAPVDEPPVVPPTRVPWIAAGTTLLGAIVVGLVVRGCPPAAAPDAGVDARADVEEESAVVRVVPQAPPPREPTCPEGMALIRGGTFQMGSSDGVGGLEHAVTVGTFCIDKTEVSVAEYQACETARACTAPNAYSRMRGSSSNFCNWERPGASDHPVNCVDWSQARVYCAWSGNPRGEGRLLGEAEWEFAARGTAGRKYPWGDTPEPDGTRVNLCGEECAVYGRSLGFNWSKISGWRDGFGATAPVTSFELGETPEHVRNLAGNVWEWVEDEYVSDAYAQHTSDGHLRARDASTTSPSTEYRVLRGGGCWSDYAASVARAAYRDRDRPSLRLDGIGVRCARGAR